MFLFAVGVKLKVGEFDLQILKKKKKIDKAEI